MVDGWRAIKEVKEVEDSGVVLCGTKLMEAFRKLPYDEGGRYYVYADAINLYRFLNQYTRYETNGKVVFSKNIDSMVGENVYVYTKEPEKYIDCFIENIAHFEYQEETYYLLYIKSEGLKKHNSNIIGG